jgi:hypothetical protein
MKKTIWRYAAGALLAVANMATAFAVLSNGAAGSFDPNPCAHE